MNISYMQQQVRKPKPGKRSNPLSFLLSMLLSGLFCFTMPVGAAPEESAGQAAPLPQAQIMQDIPSLLFKANEAYLAGNYPEAAELYQAIDMSGHLNGNIFYNLGNCYMRLGETGKAILNYKKARLLLPRDGDLKANLQYARSLRQDSLGDTSSSLWHSLAFWYFGMNFKELLVIFGILNLIFWVAALILLYRDSEWAKWTLALSLLLGLVMGISCGLKYRETFQNNQGVILDQETPVRAGFSRKDTVLFALHNGAEFKVLDKEKGWYKISLPDEKKGWLPAGSAGLVELRSPLAGQ